LELDAVAPNFTYSTAVESLKIARPFTGPASANRATLLAELVTFASVADCGFRTLLLMIQSRSGLIQSRGYCHPSNRQKSWTPLASPVAGALMRGSPSLGQATGGRSA